MEKPTGGESSGTRRSILWQCNNPVNICCLQNTLWIHFHHPYIWQHFDAALPSWPQHLLKYVGPGHHICITVINCPLIHGRSLCIPNGLWPIICTGVDIVSDRNITCNAAFIPNDPWKSKLSTVGTICIYPSCIANINANGLAIKWLMNKSVEA